MQSAPDEFGNIVFSACIDKSKLSFSFVLFNKFETDAAAATQHADEEPSPAPIGISAVSYTHLTLPTILLV